MSDVIAQSTGAKEEYQVPSNPVDRQKIKKAIQEAANALMQIDGQRDLIKNIRDDIKEQFEMPTSTFNQLANALHKNNIREKAEKAEALTDNYSLLFGSDNI